MEILKTIQSKVELVEKRGSIEIYQNPETLFFSIKVNGEWINNSIEFYNYKIEGNIIGVKIKFNGESFYSYYLINEKKWLKLKNRRFKNAEVYHKYLILKNLDGGDSVYFLQEKNWLRIHGKTQFKLVSLEENHLFIRATDGEKYRYDFKTKILNN